LAGNEMRIEVSFDTEEEAIVVQRALSVDDDEYVRTTLDGRNVVAVFSGDSLQTLRRAGDDWMACLMAIVKEGSG